MATSLDSIQNQLIPITALRAHPQNFRHHPETQLVRLSASLQRFSQYRSIVCQAQADGSFLLVAGHGLVEAAKREGLQELRADVLPPSYSAEDIAGILLSDNLSSNTAEDDLAALATMLQEQANAGFDLASLGSSKEELDALLAEVTKDTLEEGRTTELNEPEGGEVQGAFSVLVECKSEAEQQHAYELLTEKGFSCRVLTL